MDPPPPLVLFSTIDKYLQALATDDREEHEGTLQKLYRAGLPPVTSTRALSVLFGIRPEFIGAIVRRPARYYRRFQIKKGASLREIAAPRVAIKLIQCWLGYYLSRSVEFDDCVFGFVPGRSAIAGASKHCGAKWVYSTDIENFFPSTKPAAVEAGLVSVGYSKQAAWLISRLSSIDDGLAQGSPASPVLSNLAVVPMDKAIQDYCLQNQLVYTRYADDVVISGIEERPPDIGDQIEGMIQNAGYSISKRKTRCDALPRRLKVYGLLVHERKPKLTKGYRKRIRAIEHARNNGKLAAADEQSALGHLAYARSVERFTMKQ